MASAADCGRVLKVSAWTESALNTSLGRVPSSLGRVPSSSSGDQKTAMGTPQ